MDDQTIEDIVLADVINMYKAQLNPETGKNYGLRAIAEFTGETYGRIRYVDNKYNKHYDKYDPELREEYTGIEPVRTYVWDLETTNLNTFMGQLIAASFLDMATGKIYTASINDYADLPPVRAEQALLEWVVDRQVEADILIGHNTLGFDQGFLRGRLAIHDMDITLPKRQQWDTYLIARHGFKGKPQGYSLENLADFFRLPVGKDKPSKHDWAASIILNAEAIDRIVERCEADVVVTALLWAKLRRFFHEWRGR